MIIFHSSRIDKYNFYGNSQTCTFFSASVYDYFSLFNKRQMQLPWQCIFFTQVGGLFNSISTMKFSPIFISIVMAFTSSLVSGLTCAVGAEPVCVTERKCELPEHGGRCVPQQVCDCVWKPIRPVLRGDRDCDYSCTRSGGCEVIYVGPRRRGQTLVNQNTISMLNQPSLSCYGISMIIL